MTHVDIRHCSPQFWTSHHIGRPRTRLRSTSGRRRQTLRQGPIAEFSGIGVRPTPLRDFQPARRRPTWAPEGPGPATIADIQLLSAYLTFFDKVAQLLELRALDLHMVDSMFVHRFFIGVNNPHSHRIILSEEGYWPAIITLHRMWSTYRRRANLPIPNAEHSLLAADKSHADRNGLA